MVHVQVTYPPLTRSVTVSDIESSPADEYCKKKTITFNLPIHTNTIQPYSTTLVDNTDGQPYSTTNVTGVT
jgi:hypothetical protein